MADGDGGAGGNVAAIAAAKKTARVKPRNLRWSVAEKAGFLDALAASGNVHRAAAVVGRTDQGAHAMRRRDAAFAASWREALEAASDLLQAAVIAHALGGPAVVAGMIGMDETLPGDPAPPPPCPTCGAGGMRAFDPELALRIMAQRAARGGATRSVPSSNYRQLPMTEVETALDRRIDAIIAARAKGGIVRKRYGSGARAQAGRRARGEA